jgi:soluble lytic murein transglycosylase
MKRNSKKKTLKSFMFFLICVIILCIGFFHREKIASFLGEMFYTKTHRIEYSEQVKNASMEFGVPEDLIYAVIKTESNFNPDALSSAGAIGLMQLMPDTYSWIAMRLGEADNQDMISDVSVNIRYGTYYLSFLMERFEDEKVIYAAYNAGYSRVKGWLADSRYSADGKHLDVIPYDETSSYVEKVSSSREKYKRLLSEEI